MQLMKNRANHSGIKRSPYEALFGTKITVGLNTSDLPQDALKNISSEEELKAILESVSTGINNNTNQIENINSCNESVSLELITIRIKLKTSIPATKIPAINTFCLK